MKPDIRGYARRLSALKGLVGPGMAVGILLLSEVMMVSGQTLSDSTPKNQRRAIDANATGDAERLDKLSLRVVLSRSAAQSGRGLEWRLEQAAEAWCADLKLASGLDLDLGFLWRHELELDLSQPSEETVVVVGALLGLQDVGGSSENWKPLYAIERGGGLPIELIALARSDRRHAELETGLVLCDGRDGLVGLASRWFSREIVKSAGSGAGVDPVVRFGRSDSSHWAIHTVFFGGASACVVKRDDFESAARRNPQLAKELEMLGAMRPVIGDVLALRESVEPARVAVVEQTAGLMGRSVSGRKLMRLLGWKGLRPMGDILKKSYENALNEATGGSRRAGSGKLEQFVVQPEKGDGGEEK